MEASDKEGSATLALPTRLEEDFISPLTAIRGALEILRDYPDIDPDKHRHFVSLALQECSRLETSINDLARSVYAAGEKAVQQKSPSTATESDTAFSDRLSFHADPDYLHLDFSDLTLENSDMVNGLFNFVARQIQATGRQWLILIDMTGCIVWPEAWVAFAHRAKKLAAINALGIAQYDISAGPSSSGETFASREEALKALQS